LLINGETSHLLATSWAIIRRSPKVMLLANSCLRRPARWQVRFSTACRTGITRSSDFASSIKSVQKAKKQMVVEEGAESLTAAEQFYSLAA
jgi:hypothetical protein